MLATQKTGQGDAADAGGGCTGGWVVAVWVMAGFLGQTGGIESRGRGSALQVDGGIEGQAVLDLPREFVAEDFLGAGCEGVERLLDHGPVSYTHLTLPTSDLV